MFYNPEHDKFHIWLNFQIDIASPGRDIENDEIVREQNGVTYDRWYCGPYMLHVSNHDAINNTSFQEKSFKISKGHT